MTNNDGPDWEGVARELLATELEDQTRQLEETTKEITERLRNDEDITEDDLRNILAGVQQFWYYVDRDLLAVANIDELPEDLESYWL